MKSCLHLRPEELLIRVHGLEVSSAVCLVLVGEHCHIKPPEIYGYKDLITYIHFLLILETLPLLKML